MGEANLIGMPIAAQRHVHLLAEEEVARCMLFTEWFCDMTLNIRNKLVLGIPSDIGATTLVSTSPPSGQAHFLEF